MRNGPLNVLNRRKGKEEYDLDLKATNLTLEPPPYNMTIRKGSKVSLLYYFMT